MAIVLPRPIHLPQVKPMLVILLCAGLLAAAVRSAPGTACVHKAGTHVCTCANCPGGALCCCRK